VPGETRTAIRSRGIAVAPRKRLEGAPRVIPQRPDLDRLADPRRDHPSADLGIHPRQSRTGLAGEDHAVHRVEADMKTRPAFVRVDDREQQRKQIAGQTRIADRIVVRADRFDKPERRVHDVVFRRAKIIGSIPPSTKRANVRRIFSATAGPVVNAIPGSAIIVSRPPKRQTMIAGDDRRRIGIARDRPGNDELIGSQHELRNPMRRASPPVANSPRAFAESAS
jgi:hypothetical protein